MTSLRHVSNVYVAFFFLSALKVSFEFLTEREVGEALTLIHLVDR